MGAFLSGVWVSGTPREDRPVASRHGATHRVRLAVAACRRWLLGMALDIMRPGAGARDPGMVSPSAFGT